MDSRIGVRPAAFPDHRSAETAIAPVLALAFLALSAIGSGLGFVVLGLDQGRASRYRIWNRFGADPIRRNAPQSASLMVLFLGPFVLNPLSSVLNTSPM